MSSRNQNKPPVNVQKTRAVDDAPLDKRRKIGTGRMMASTTASRGRQALAPMSNQKDASNPAPVAPSETEVSECEDITFTKEEVIELLNDKFKGKKFDTKLKQEWMTKHIKKLHDCIKWFQKALEDLQEEKDNMRTMLDSSETKYLEAEAAMKIKEEELSSTISKLENNILSLKESLANEQSQKQAAIDGHNTEKEVSMALTKDRDSLKEKLFVSEQNLSTANDKVKQQEDMYKRLQEYNTSLQQYNSKLQNELKTATDANKQVEKEKAAILENHSTLRGHYSLLQKEFTSAKDSLDNAVKQKEDATNEVRVLRSELQKLREDRESQLSEIQDLKSEILRYKDNTGRTAAEVHNLSLKSTALEETCSDQSKQISILEHQLAAANQKLKMADLTSSEIRTEYEGQKEMISKLEDQLREKEGQLNEGERLRKKLHNTILELKGNIRVFCRVRPMLSDDAPGADATVCYPTSVELAERGIEIVQNGQITPFTFDKVFKQNASQEDVFMEISQLVQSALDGYKVCIFAYGQTGSGKTYTMMGPEIPKESKGLIPRSLKQIFETSQTLAAQGWEFKMQASMLEIYNETIRDLLLKSNTGDSSSVEVVGGRTKGLTVVDVTSENEVSKLLKRASQSRAVGRTDMNEQSSRSHFVFTLNIDGVNPHTEQRVQGVLNLIDLAGSERLSKSGATGDRLTETKHINKSLSALSEVILALGKKEDHIPYRNSKLTYLLQPCLGGDSKTLMFVNVSPDPLSVNESLCALKFAARVNSCEIGIPRRQTSRPIDSRLSCG